ncbi:MAG: serine--tRNA ligase [Alphaproteobacteria bacterium]
MLDIQWIRQHEQDFIAAMQRRGVTPEQYESIIALDAGRRQALSSLQEAQSRRNSLSKQVPEVKKAGGDVAALIAEVGSLKEKIAHLEQEANRHENELDYLLLRLPNPFDESVPDGADEESNQLVKSFGDDKRRPEGLDHVAIGEQLGLMDFEAAAYISGARFVVLKGALARLERALGQFMLNTALDHGYQEHAVPFLVRENALLGTGQLPKFTEDLFQTPEGYWLIPTSEVPLTNLVADKILSEAELPLRLTALTPCFRSEAGSAGRDTKGIIRQHQFWKVEMVSITTPQASNDELERMTQCAEKILELLELPYRTVLKCAGDTGFSARKSYDIEVWLPSQKTWREISSCSNCGDFQARRMKARYRTEVNAPTKLVHTLNGSGVAVGRALVAILENYYQPDGTVTIPTILQPYMGDMKNISVKK